MRTIKRHRSAPINTKVDRSAFWTYCKRATAVARNRATDRGFPYAIDAHFIDQLLVDQKWCCAVSGVPLSAPGEAKDFWRDPFAPSMDRIVPDLGYVPGNVRVVTNIVNSAMNEWGIEALLKMVESMRSPSPRRAGE